MQNREVLINSAREYIGTPFQHQGRLLNIGIDCAGLIVCVAKEAGFEIKDQQGYARTPDSGRFVAAVLEHCDRITLWEAEPGDLAMFTFRREPQHIALISGVQPLTMIHAYLPCEKVVEQCLDAVWRKRLVGCFRLKQYV
jgi:cell wall-associated NlpC family hydrolase